MKGYMKRFLVTLGFLTLAGFVRADITSDGSNTFNSDSKQISVSSAPATQIMSFDSFITQSVIVNQSSWTSVCISTAPPSTFPTTTAPAIPPNTILTLGGNNAPWWGALWAETCNAVGGVQAFAQTISVIRTK